MIAPISIRLEATQITLVGQARMYNEYDLPPAHLFFVEAARIDSGADKGDVCGYIRHVPATTADDGTEYPAFWMTTTHLGHHHSLNVSQAAALHQLMALAYSYVAGGL